MILLRKLYLRNWNRYGEELLEFSETSTLITGKNGLGKSAIFDALQVAMIADLRQVSLNTSANELNGRNLAGYVLGALEDGFHLRPSPNTGIIAVEFFDTVREEPFTLVVVIEAETARSADKLHIFVHAAYDPTWFINTERQSPMDIREAKQKVKHLKGARSFDSVKAYREHLLHVFGNVQERFFELFGRMMSYRPVSDVNRFVRDTLLTRRGIALDELEETEQKMKAAKAELEQQERELAALNRVVDRQREAREEQRKVNRTVVLLDLLRREAARKALADTETKIKTSRAMLQSNERRITLARAEEKQARSDWDDVKAALSKHDVRSHQASLERRIRDLQDEVETRRKARQDAHQQAEGMLAALEGALPDGPALRDSRAALMELEEQQRREPLREAVDRLRGVLGEARRKAIGVGQDREQAVTRLRDSLDGLRKELDDIESRQRVSAPRALERFQSALAEALGERPPMLFETLEVDDEPAQAQVEAALATHRYAFLVPPEHLERAIEMAQARSSDNAPAILLADTRNLPPADAAPSLLAGAVQSDNPVALRYAHAVLAGIPIHATLDDARAHGQGMTQTLLRYGQHTITTLGTSHLPWVIGNRARENRRAQIVEQVSKQEDALTQAEEDARDSAALEKLLMNQERVAISLHVALSKPMETTELEGQLTKARDELARLDTSGIDELVKRERELAGAVQALEVEIGDLQGKNGGLEEAIAHATSAWAEQAEKVKATSATADTTCKQYPATVVEGAEAEVKRRLKAQTDLEKSVAATEGHLEHTMRKALVEARHAYEAAATDFHTNIKAGFAASPTNLNEGAYLRAQRQLMGGELDKSRQQVEKMLEAAREGLEATVLHGLHERFELLEEELGEINRVLRNVTFEGERYRFVWEPNDDFREFYDLIMDVTHAALGNDSLRKSEVYTRYEDTIQELLRQLTGATTEQEGQRRDALLDYRNYFTFDIRRERHGRVSKVSNTMRTASGGERQVPFYVVLAAAFATLYRSTGNQHDNHTLRLVGLDEAAHAMDGVRVEAMVDLFTALGLQPAFIVPASTRAEFQAACDRSYIVLPKDDHSHLFLLQHLDDPAEAPEGTIILDA